MVWRRLQGGFVFLIQCLRCNLFRAKTGSQAMTQLTLLSREKNAVPQRLLELSGCARYRMRHIGGDKASSGNGRAKQGGTTILSSLQVLGYLSGNICWEFYLLGDFE